MISIFNGRKRTLGGEESEIYAQVGVEFRGYLGEFKGARLGVFLAICLHADEGGWAFPSYDLLAKETGYNRETVSRALADLCKLTIKGDRVLLRYQPQHNQEGEFLSNRYLIFPGPAEVTNYEGAGVKHLGAEAWQGPKAEPDPPCTGFPNTVKPYTENPYTKKNHPKEETVTTTAYKSRKKKKAEPLTEEQQAALALLLTVPRMDPAPAKWAVKHCDLAKVAGWVTEGKQAPEDIAAALVIRRLSDDVPPPVTTSGKDQDQDRRRFAEGAITTWEPEQEGGDNLGE